MGDGYLRWAGILLGLGFLVWLVIMFTRKAGV